MTDLELIDNKDFLSTDSDRLHIGINTNSGYKNSPMVPKNCLVRFQFLEMFVRVAIARFFRPSCPEIKSEAQAVEKAG